MSRASASHTSASPHHARQQERLPFVRPSHGDTAPACVVPRFACDSGQLRSPPRVECTWYSYLHENEPHTRGVEPSTDFTAPYASRVNYVSFRRPHCPIFSYSPTRAHVQHTNTKRPRQPLLYNNRIKTAPSTTFFIRFCAPHLRPVHHHLHLPSDPLRPGLSHQSPRPCAIAPPASCIHPAGPSAP